MSVRLSRLAMAGGIALALLVGGCRKKAADGTTAEGEGAGNYEGAALAQLRQAQTLEARNMLGEIAGSARSYAMEEHVARGGAVAPRGFPIGDTGYQPAPGACCKEPNGKCVVRGGEWNADPWPSLGFSISDPYAYSYRYTSDGQAFAAYAVGDLDCDGTFSTFLIQGQMAGESPSVAGISVENEIE